MALPGKVKGAQDGDQPLADGAEDTVGAPGATDASASMDKKPAKKKAKKKLTSIAAVKAFAKKKHGV